MVIIKSDNYCFKKRLTTIAIWTAGLKLIKGIEGNCLQCPMPLLACHRVLLVISPVFSNFPVSFLKSLNLPCLYPLHILIKVWWTVYLLVNLFWTLKQVLHLWQEITATRLMVKLVVQVNYSIWLIKMSIITIIVCDMTIRPFH